MVMEMMIITIDLAYKFLAEIKIDLSDEKINLLYCVATSILILFLENCEFLRLCPTMLLVRILVSWLFIHCLWNFFFF